MRGPGVGSGGAGEGLGCLGYNALPVVDIAVALGELCNFIHKMAACIILVVVDFVGWGCTITRWPPLTTGDGCKKTYRKGGNSWG